MSSVTPVESKECYEGLKDKGVGFVDAPVSGGEPGAVAGTLAIMAGGDQEDFDAMKEYFDILGSFCVTDRWKRKRKCYKACKPGNR